MIGLAPSGGERSEIVPRQLLIRFEVDRTPKEAMKRGRLSCRCGGGGGGGGEGGGVGERRRRW